jgi:hypothetical protein
MAKAQADQNECSNACELYTECIKISGRSKVFNAKLVKYVKNELVLVSKTAVHPETFLVVRIMDFSASKCCHGSEFPRMSGITEVQYVQEIMEDEGIAYELGVKYLYMD